MENRPILPKPSTETGRHGPTGPTTGNFTLPKRKKAASRTACDLCRARKSACDGQRPTCSTCRSKGTECFYKSRDKVIADESSTELLAKLKSLPEDEAIHLLRRLRAGHELDTPSSRLSTSPWSSRPQSGSLSHGWAAALSAPSSSSSSSTAASTAAPGRLRPGLNFASKVSGIEFELMTRFPIAYPTLLPINLGTSMPEVDKGSDNERLREAPYCDDRLRHVDIQNWTEVPISNEMAAKILSFYLTVDHPVLGLFDADLFLGDLVSGDHNFCSRLLVNAVLAWASQAYGVVDPDAAKHKDALFGEAIRAFESTKHRNTLTTVAAAYLISHHANCRNNHELASRLFSEALIMGHRMGLYGATEEGSARNWLDNHHDWIRAASHTAWGAYCAITLHSLQYQVSVVETPPLLPIPSEVGAVLERTKGDRFKSYPTPSFMGQTFNKLCALLQIAYKIPRTYYSGVEGSNMPNRPQPATNVSVESAEGLFRELLTWSSTLPLELVRTDNSPHRAIIVHLYFHCLVLDIFRPFCQRSEPGQLSSFAASAGKGDIDAVCRASVDQLKRLVLMCLTKFEASSYCFLFQTSLLYLCNALVWEVKIHGTKTQDEQWRFYFRLCVEGLARLFRAFDVIELLLKAMLCLTVRAKALELQDACNIFDEVRRKERPGERNSEPQEGDKGKVPPDYQDNSGGASVIVDLNLATSDPDAATLAALTAQFDDLTMQSGHRHQADQHEAEKSDQQRSGPSGRQHTSDTLAPDMGGATSEKAEMDAGYPVWENEDS